VGEGVYEGRSVMAMTKEEIAAYDRAYREANKEKLAANRKARYEANREKELAKSKAWYEANREEALANHKTYREANKEAISASNKAYHEANREKILANKKAYHEANREKILAYKKAYQKANKEAVIANNAKHRARKRNLIPVHLRDCPHEKQRLVQIYKLRSIISEATGVQHHVDHMWPLSDGGPHWSGNLQVIPAEENLSKNASVCEDTKATIIKSLYTFESERSI